MRIRVLKDRRLVPPGARIVVQFPKGLECTVKREWGEALVADGDAEEIETHHRPAKDA